MLDCRYVDIDIGIDFTISEWYDVKRWLLFLTFACWLVINKLLLCIMFCFHFFKPIATIVPFAPVVTPEQSVKTIINLPYLLPRLSRLMPHTTPHLTVQFRSLFSG